MKRDVLHTVTTGVRITEARQMSTRNQATVDSVSDYASGSRERGKETVAPNLERRTMPEKYKHHLFPRGLMDVRRTDP